jgi:hypothetical protein
MMTNNRIRKTASRRFVPCLAILDGRTLPSTFTVLNLADRGAGSLRDAVQAANSNPDPDMIGFAKGVQGTIPLTSGGIEITTDLAINGPRADTLTVSGSDASQIFRVVGGGDESRRITVSISGLTLCHGRADRIGSAAENLFYSDLILSRVVLSDNRDMALPDFIAAGGAATNSGAGANLTLVDSQVVHNTADGAGGIGSAGGGIQ